MDLKKINEQLTAKKLNNSPSRHYGVMGICLGYDLHERFVNYVTKKNLKMSQIIRLLVKSYLDEMENNENI